MRKGNGNNSGWRCWKLCAVFIFFFFVTNNDVNADLNNAREHWTNSNVDIFEIQINANRIETFNLTTLVHSSDLNKVLSILDSGYFG